RLGQVIYRAWRSGCVFDAWSEHFKSDRWIEAFRSCGLDPEYYAHRQWALDDPLPWGHIDTGISPSFLKRELRRIHHGEETPDCRQGSCSACGFQDWHQECRDRLAASSVERTA
ncbi:MAG: B12-binding domain-containing radical SAM protein, partial [Dehalococcoidia bacterium]|nr:B12-binding domain-containing radical SAM protein [Dehalococcoidia bacterium]